MSLRENELAHRNAAGGLELRPDPLRLRWELTDLAAADGHELRVAFSASVRAVDDRTERRMLEEVLLNGKPSLPSEDIIRHFAPALRAAAARSAQAHPAPEWSESDAPKSELVSALRAAAVPVAFACGLEVLPPFLADVQSPSYERQRLRAMQQQLAEQQAAGQIEHFNRAAELLKQFQALRTAAPELSAGCILEQISPAERGSAMHALLRASAGAADALANLWAVAGPYLVRIDLRGLREDRGPGGVPPKPELFPLPPVLGPMRSIQSAEVDGRRVLLAGAQRGFLRIDAASPVEARPYADPGFESPHGFNAVVYWPARRQFCATHSEAGLVCWDADASDAAAHAVRAAAMGVLPAYSTAPPVEVSSANSINMSIRGGGTLAGPRNLQVLDDESLIFSIGGRLLTWDGQHPPRPIAQVNESEVIAILTRDRHVYIVHEDGTVCTLDRASRQIIAAERRSGRVRAAAALPWLGGSRLLLAGDDGPVQCVGFDDPLVTQYASAYRGLRALAAGADLIAAVSPDRQRLILWHSWEGRQPAAELYVTALTRHRIADVELG